MYRAIICLAALSCFSPPAAAYSVLTHQAIIDAVWDQSIQPLLLQRYPAATP